MEELEKLGTEAQAAKRGLWAEADPVPPWEWRALRNERSNVTS
jgi:micrococcal nuclease